jgi:DNA ligase (NAD+)
MLSLGNSYNAEDLTDFDGKIKRLLNLDEDLEIEYCVEPKFDGGSIAVIYKENQLNRSATRGNGTKGELMTSNAKAIPSIPLQADFLSKGMHTVELRGEGLIRIENFKKINAQREKEGLSIFANPRNAATGGLRMKDPNETRKRGLEVFMFQIGYASDAEGNDVMSKLSTHYEGIELLGNLGFKVPSKAIKKCKNIKEAIDFCAYWQDNRENYPYEIDGMVVKVNSLDLQRRAGFTGHHPRWAIAYKFKAKQATTTLEGVEYQIGKIGSVTPVAKVTPVQLAGVTVSSISLHNQDFISSKDLRIGDKVLIERAGDVIPYIVKSFPDLRDALVREIEFPTHCPSCKTELVKAENEAAWRCPNYHCVEQVKQRMYFHVSKNAMDIDGFGPSYVDRFYHLGWIKDLADIYTLNYAGIAGLEGFGQRSAQKIESAIDKAKKNPIHRLLHSLSVHHLGKKASQLIAQNIESVFDLQNWSVEDFVDIKDIGPVVADNVVAYFKDEENIALLRKLEAAGVNMLQTEDDKPVNVAADAPLIGKSILFTGTLQKMGRKEAQEMAVKAGAKNISAVSSKLNILVVGEKAGSKLKKAQALGTVEILTEDQFLELFS